MKLTITGSLGNISKPLTEKLIAEGHQVTVISSDPQKIAAIEALNATAAIGSVEDVSFLTDAFSGADAIYTMVPPHFGATDWKGYIAGIGRNYAEAIRKSGVKYVVNLSSIGAHLAEGAGPVSGIHRVENIFNELEDVNVVHLRPASFYTNFYNNAGMIKDHGMIGGNYDADTVLVLVDTHDIAEAAAENLLNLSFQGKSVQYVVSDVLTAAEVAAILGAAVGKPELPWVPFTDDQTLAGMLQSGMPEYVAENFLEMGIAMRTGKLFEDYDLKTPLSGKIRLKEFAKVFAATI